MDMSIPHDYPFTYIVTFRNTFTCFDITNFHLGGDGEKNDKYNQPHSKKDAVFVLLMLVKLTVTISNLILTSAERRLKDVTDGSRSRQSNHSDVQTTGGNSAH